MPVRRRAANVSGIAIALIVGLAAGAGIVYATVSLSVIPSNPNVVVIQTQRITTSGTISTEMITTSGAATFEVSSLQDELSSFDNLLSESQANASILQNQLGAAKLNLTSVENQLTASKTNASILQNQLSAAKLNLTSVENQLTASKTNATTLQDQIANLNSQITADGNQIRDLQAQVSADASQIATLQDSISADNAQTASLQSTINSLQSSLASANAVISSLQSEVSQQQAATLIGAFSVTNNCPLGGNCTYTINGAYANLGTSATSSANVTFTFYLGIPKQVNLTVVCSTTVNLYTVYGRTIDILPQATCASNSSTVFQSFTWAFASS